MDFPQPKSNFSSSSYSRFISPGAVKALTFLFSLEMVTHTQKYKFLHARLFVQRKSSFCNFEKISS